MKAVTSARLRVENIKPLVGSVIHTGADDLVRGTHAAEIRRLLDDRVVLLFPQVHLSAEQQIAFTRTLGIRNEDLSKDIWKVSTDRSVNPNPALANYQRSSVMWHMDAIQTSVPDLATTLCAQALSSGEGGQTEVANMYAAYADLPDDDKAWFETLRVVHSFETHMRTVTPAPSEADVQDWRRPGTSSRRLVWTHRSGRKSLVLGAHASHIEGMDLDEGRAILRRLQDWATQDKYVYSHDWRIGDLMIFNNSGSLHRAVAYPPDSGRLMHRTSLRGEETID